MQAEIASVDSRCKPSCKRQAHRLWYRDPVSAGGEHAADFHAHAKAKCADGTGVGRVAIIVEIEHARQQQAGFHWENVAVTAAADIEEIFHAPGLRSSAIECAHFSGARTA